MLEDLFYPDTEDPRPHRTPVYIPRLLPIVCHDCNITCTTYKGLVEHCCTLQHQIATIPRDRRIPKEFWDPRDNQSAFMNKTPFEQVQACMKYKHKIIDFLRAPMDDAGVRNMEAQLECIPKCATRNQCSTENCTLERVIATCVDFVLDDFAQEGMSVHGYCRDVILGGWGSFDCHGSSSSEGLFLSVVEA